MNLRLALGAVLPLAIAGAVPSLPQAAAPAPAATSGPNQLCTVLSAPGQFPQTNVTSALDVPADPAKGLPAYCQVTAVISPVPASRIGVVYRLPQAWNGKLLGLGGGGWAGNVTVQAASAGLAKGYATAQTDGGHPGTTAFDSSWTKDAPEALTDFSYRAVHLMTTTAKLVAAKYYGHAQSKAYFQGCSTGGRMALMEVQRFPTDYNAVVAGAPVYSLVTQTSSIVRNLIFSAPGAAFSDAELALVNKAALRACDTDDGIRDGVVGDPRTCRWDPVQLQCPSGISAPGECLSPAQIDALRKAYSLVQPKRGGVSAYPLTRGGELGWSRSIATGPDADISSGQGIADIRKPIFGDAQFDLTGFDPEKHQAMVRSTPFAKMYEAANPDISAFVKAGGKLVIWHGWDDPGPSPYATIDYYEGVEKTTGPKIRQPLSASARLFLAPGVYHCGGGPGPDQFDMLAVIDRWSETDIAPASIFAAKAGTLISRPLCAYPAVARYKGDGDPDDARNFACQAPASAGPHT